MNLGVPEIILILVVALLFFGPSRLPSLGKSVGEAIRGFKKGLSGNEDQSTPRSQQQIEQKERNPVDQSFQSMTANEKKKEDQSS